MSFIDKKGKILGIINIVDLLIVMFVIAVLAGGVYKFTHLGEITDEEQTPLLLTIEVEDTNEGLVDAIKTGDILKDSVRGTEFGKVLDKKVKPHKELVINKDGKVEYKEIPGAFDVEIQVEAYSITTEDGYLVATKPIYIGSETRLKSDLYVFNCTVLDIKE